MKCKLCESKKVDLFFKDQSREYLHCPVCDLIFVPEEGYVSVDCERERYNLHDNNAKNKGYASFLNEVASVVQEITDSKCSVLDFGCGKYAVLSYILRNFGYSCDSYDPLFGIEIPFCKRAYDVVILCEVIEHLRDISNEIQRINNILDCNGNVIIRTQLCENKDSFKSWWYKQDYTHINFFSHKSLSYCANRFGYTISETNYHDVFVFTKEG